MSLHDEERLIDEAKSFFADSSSFSWNLVSTRFTQFPYFDELLGHPEWEGKKILDFGGNVGTFLESANGRVAHEDYWCLDLNPAVVEQGRRTYPRAHFLHFNRYGPQYNPRGVRDLPLPDLGMKFDFILAFSVFTHVDLYEMVELAGSLRRMLARGGALAFTFFEPHYDRSLSDPSLPRGTSGLKNLGPRGAFPEVKRAKWYVVVDDQLYLEPGETMCHQKRNGKPLENYCSFFTAGLMKAVFPGATVHPPVQREWQHCCILRN